MICQNEIQKGLSLQQQPRSGAHLAMGDCRGIVEHCRALYQLRYEFLYR
jgi:hypothetical protein